MRANYARLLIFVTVSVSMNIQKFVKYLDNAHGHRYYLARIVRPGPPHSPSVCTTMASNHSTAGLSNNLLCINSTTLCQNYSEHVGSVDIVDNIERRCLRCLFRLPPSGEHNLA